MTLTFVAVPTWTNERVELVEKLWKARLSASQIAAELGGVTRNAVMGIIHRRGIGPGGMPRKVQLRSQKPRTSRIRLVSIAKKSDPGLTSTTPLEQRKTLLELTNETCRWPEGEPRTAEFFFCGAEEADFTRGRVYCRRHAAMAGAVSVPRQRRGAA